MFLLQVLIEAATCSGDTVSCILQNAETVRLIGPSPKETDTRADTVQWHAVSIAELSPGNVLYILSDDTGNGRHTGIQVRETGGRQWS